MLRESDFNERNAQVGNNQHRKLLTAFIATDGKQETRPSHTNLRTKPLTLRIDTHEARFKSSRWRKKQTELEDKVWTANNG